MTHVFLNIHSTFDSNQSNKHLLIQDPLIRNSIPTDDSILLLLSFLSSRMPFAFNSNPAPFKLNWRPPIPKSFSFTPTWFWSHWITVPHQSLGNPSVLCLASCKTFIVIFMHMFSPQWWNELLGRQGHIYILCILPPESSATPAVNAQSGGIRQWGRKWLIYILNFVGFCQAWIF